MTQETSEHQQLIDALGMLLEEQRRTTEAVIYLAEAVAGVSPATKAADSTKVEKATPEPTWEEPDCTKEQLQSYCLARTRQEDDFKPKIMAELKKYEVKTIKALKDADAPKVYAALEAQ